MATGKKIFLKKRGYLTIELLVGMSALTVGLFGFYSLLANSIGQNRLVSDQITANYLAMEGIELAKNLIDYNIVAGVVWNSGFDMERCYELDYLSDNLPAGSVGCPDGSVQSLLLSQSSGVFSYQSGVKTGFYRTIKITPIGNDRVKINSLVKGSGRGGTKINVELEDNFYNWH